MTTKTEDRAATERRTMDRYAKRLNAAYKEAAENDGAWWQPDDGTFFGDHQLAILRASAAALYPGRQNRRHLLPALGKMVTAACRVIRRGGK